MIELSFHLCWCCFLGGKKLLWTEYSLLSSQDCLKNLQARLSGKFLSRGPQSNDSKQSRSDHNIKTQRERGRWECLLETSHTDAGLTHLSTHIPHGELHIAGIGQEVSTGMQDVKYHHLGVALGSTVPYLPPFP